jgi:hypothetical protein
MRVGYRLRTRKLETNQNADVHMLGCQQWLQDREAAFTLLSLGLQGAKLAESSGRETGLCPVLSRDANQGTKLQIVSGRCMMHGLAPPVTAQDGANSVFC